MPNDLKYQKILDALQTLLEDKDIKNISVSEIARAAGMGKGSLYYYFPSKDAILEALVERDYEKPLKTAKNLAGKADISPFLSGLPQFFCSISSWQRLGRSCQRSGASFHPSEIPDLPDLRDETCIDRDHPSGHRRRRNSF